MVYNNPYMYGGAGSGMNFGTNPYYAPYMQNQMFQQQPQAQATPQPQVEPQQSAVLFDEIKFVNADQAKSYMVLAGRKSLLVDRANKNFYIKTGNALGEATTEVYKYERVNTQDDAKRAKETPSAAPEYVLKDELKGFVTNDKLESAIKGLREDFNKGITELRKSNVKKILDGEEK